MENKRVLFITFDMSGYYDGVYQELQNRYAEVEYFNTATYSYRYKNIVEKARSFILKITTGKKLKDFLKYNSIIQYIQNNKYDITIIIRPDLFFDSQLAIIRANSKYFIAYYHDSVNEIKRGKDVIHFFDKVYSYEKRDVEKYHLTFLPNFIYFDNEKIVTAPNNDNVAFTVMSHDFRFTLVKKLASYLYKNNIAYRFFVMSKKKKDDGLIRFISKRMNNAEVLLEIMKCKVIIDIHKYGIQDGLTFRVFESLGFDKKLITTNQDIKSYDFFNTNNICVIEKNKDIEIPLTFFDTPYEKVPDEIISNYKLKTWVSKLLSQ